jgi:hypothetical protein
MSEHSPAVLTRRLRTYWHAVILAASVSLGSVRSDFDAPIRQPHSIVQMRVETNDLFSPRELVGDRVVTQKLSVPGKDSGERLTGSPN